MTHREEGTHIPWILTTSKVCVRPAITANQQLRNPEIPKTMYEIYDRDEVSGAKGFERKFNIGCLIVLLAFAVWVILYGIIL